ncbi:MAG: TetR/AcrR family transcriptional regulator [Thiomicrorhabdus sp.]|nr:TetR/AcrR family transcriptional regulator [Thiomicrorhabdus sp.]
MTSKDTKQEIAELALKCFSQFGFSKTNMSLISEYTGYSRVTVHKYFKNKRVLFRNVVQLCMTNSIGEAESRLQEIDVKDPWDVIEEYLVASGKKVFENVHDDYILKDLHNAINELAEDLVDSKQKITIQFIQAELSRGVKENLIALTPIQTTPEELARLLDYCYLGIMRNASVQHIKGELHHLLRVYRQATQVA